MLIAENYLQLWSDALQAAQMDAPLKPRLRFAPSPTGALHMGNIYSALYIKEAAAAISGEASLRIEDIDFTRCHPEYEAAMIADLNWAGFIVKAPPRRQSEHTEYYKGHLKQLAQKGLIYPCFCSRKDIDKALDAQKAQGHEIELGPEGPLYPESCKTLSKAECDKRIEEGTPHSWRLDVKAALSYLQKTKGAVNLDFYDLQLGWVKAAPELFGDVILARKDIGLSYHLCVTLDDAVQNISLINRGVDLFHATHIHRLLQELFDLPMPLYDHHPLLVSTENKALAKSAKSTPARAFEDNITPEKLYEIIVQTAKDNDINIKK